MLTVRTSENTVITSFRLISERQDFSSVRTAENTVRARARIHYERRVSAVNNDPELTKEAKEAADRCFGAKNVIELSEPYMISEDFSSYQKVLPGCFFFIGVKDTEHKEALHSPYFDFNDMVLIPAGAFFSYLALERLTALSCQP